MRCIFGQNYFFLICKTNKIVDMGISINVLCVLIVTSVVVICECDVQV